jgi:hypothetical protein
MGIFFFYLFLFYLDTFISVLASGLVVGLSGWFEYCSGGSLWPWLDGYV